MDSLQDQSIASKVNGSSQSPYPSESRPYAGFGRRFIAYIIDSMILFIIGATIQTGLGNSYAKYFQTLAQKGADAAQEIAKTQQYPPYLYLISIFLSALYFIGFWIKENGQTPGKRIMHIRIAREDGAPIDFFTAFVRYLFTYVSSFVLLLGYIWVLFDGKKQAWHDKAARTWVVESDDVAPSKAVYLIGCLLPILFIAMFMAIVGITAYSTVKNRVSTPVAQSRRSVSKAIDSLSSEARKHYDRSQELFTQMKGRDATREEIQKLNDENISELKKAIELDQQSALLWDSLGAAYTWVSTNGSLEDALKACKKAVELEPNNTVYLRNLANTYTLNGLYDDAILTFQNALREKSDDPFAYQGIGIAYFKLKIYDQARENLDTAVTLFQNNNKEGRYDDEILTTQKFIAGIPK